MGLKDITKGRGDIFRIDPNDLHVREGWNSRDFKDPANQEHVEALALSIAEMGVKEPLKVNWEDGKAWIVNGECRWRACMLAIKRGVPIKSVPVISDDRNANDADRLFQQFLSNTGKPFTDLERARNFKRLLDLGWSQGDIATRSGKSQGWVSQTLALLTMPEPVKQMVTNGQVSPTLAMQVVRQEGKNATQVLQDGLEIGRAHV